MIELRAATFSDIAELMPRLRPMDQFEAHAMSGGLHPAHAIQQSISMSCYVRAGVIDGHCEALWGLTEVSPAWGSYQPWMVMSDWAERNPFTFMRLSKRYIDEVFTQANYLSNYVHTTNEFSQRWLRRIGFTVDEQETIVNGHPWYQFHWERQANVHYE